ncbi:MAG: acylphosphatase [Gallicola sp.]|uniref:acylphosphatase n=1 Tax=Gallicola sp. Sow4_E12 TaxID=3438785 RepID=UPI0017F05709|nr:acylphosphatase [Gallicola sp.]
MRKRILFYGRVQGVGFRYSSYTEANLIGLTGWVRNLSDGTVEMEVQGTKEKIQQLIENISSQRFISIEYKEEEQIEEIEEEGFEIR